MEKVTFFKGLSYLDDKECIEKFLLYNSSLVIAEVKPSATISINKGYSNLYGKWCTYGKEFLESINLKYLELRNNDISLIILVYSESLLKEVLFNEESNEFLLRLGYGNNFNVDEYLDKLKERYSKYNCPHELGIFLGFDFHDVKDFIECSHKKCLGCGYWKVYNDFNKAQRIFNIYDRVREKTVYYLESDDSAYNIALTLRKHKGNSI